MEVKTDYVLPEIWKLSISAFIISKLRRRQKISAWLYKVKTLWNKGACVVCLCVWVVCMYVRVACVCVVCICVCVCVWCVYVCVYVCVACVYVWVYVWCVYVWCVYVNICLFCFLVFIDNMFHYKVILHALSFLILNHIIASSYLTDMSSITI